MGVGLKSGARSTNKSPNMSFIGQTNWDESAMFAQGCVFVNHKMRIFQLHFMGVIQPPLLNHAYHLNAQLDIYMLQQYIVFNLCTSEM